MSGEDEKYKDPKDPKDSEDRKDPDDHEDPEGSEDSEDHEDAKYPEDPDDMICPCCGNYLPGYKPGEDLYGYDEVYCTCYRCAVCDTNVEMSRCFHDVHAKCSYCRGNCHEKEACPKRPKCPKCKAFLNECKPAGNRCDHCEGKCHASIACPERPKCADCGKFYDVCHETPICGRLPRLSCERCWGSCHKKEECCRDYRTLKDLPRPAILKFLKPRA